MAVQRRFWPIPLLVLTMAVSLIGCVEEGPQVDPGPSGPAGQPGEIIILSFHLTMWRPCHPARGSHPSRHSPVSVLILPCSPGTPQVEIAGSPASLTVAFALTDDTGVPIDRAVLDFLGFTLSHLDVEPQSGLTHWISDIFRTQTSQTPPLMGLTVPQPSEESNGTLTALGNGVYRYTYATTLPAGFVPSNTYRVGVQARRTIEERRFVDNATLVFRPDGGTRLATRDVVKTENCQRCHEPFAFHGGIRTEIKVCVQCHTPQLTDPDKLILFPATRSIRSSIPASRHNPCPTRSICPC